MGGRLGRMIATDYECGISTLLADRAVPAHDKVSDRGPSC
jgi:hypothetical protein